MISNALSKKAARLCFSTAISATLLAGVAFTSTSFAVDPQTQAKPSTRDGDEVLGGSANQGRLASGETINPSDYIENESTIVLAENREPVGRDIEARNVRIAADSGSGIAVITGEPGIGKSEVVRQYIYDNPNHIVYRMKTEMLYGLSRADQAAVVKSVIIYVNKLATAHPDLKTRLHIDNLQFLNEGNPNEVRASGAITEAVAAKRPLSMLIETNAATNKKLKEQSPTFGERQNEVKVETPKFDSIVTYLQRALPQLESVTHSSISTDAVTEAARLSLRFCADDPYRKAYEMLQAAGYRVAEDLRAGETEVRRANRELDKIRTELALIEKDLGFSADPAKEARKQELTAKKENLEKLIEGRTTPDATTNRAIADLTREIEDLKKELDETPEGRFFEGKARRTIVQQITKKTAELEIKRSENLSPILADGIPAKQVVPKHVQTALSQIRPELDESVISMDIKDGIERVDNIKKKIFGQDHLVNRARTAVARGLKERQLYQEELEKNPNKKPENRMKPVWSVLVPGRTGTGKTDFGYKLGEALGMEVVTIHMSTYTERHHGSGLIGARPEYSGFGQDGELTGPVRKTPALVLILDEIQRAHVDVLKTIIYPILDQGKITDSQGRVIYFDQVIIVAPTNAGERFSSMERPALIDFLKNNQERLKEDDFANMTDPELRGACVRIDMVQTYKWEESMVGRFDDVLSSNNLTRTVIRSIVDKNAKEFVKLFASRGIQVVFDEDSINFLINSFNETEGGRSIETAFKRSYKDPLMEMWGIDKIKKGDVVVIRTEAGRMVPSVLSQHDYNTVANEKQTRLMDALMQSGRATQEAPKFTAEYFDDAYMVHNSVAKILERFGRK